MHDFQLQMQRQSEFGGNDKKAGCASSSTF